MENTSLNQSPIYESASVESYDWKLGVIIFLILIIIVFSSLGSLTNDFISNLLYSTGWFIGKSSDLVSTGAETGIDIANGAVHNGSDLLIKASKKQGNLSPDSLRSKTEKPGEPAPDTSTNPIQKPISSGKSNWCLVGEYQGKRGCIEVSDSDKCMSGQVFPSQYACLNPTFSQNVYPNMVTPGGIPPRIDLTALPNNHPTYDQQQYAKEQILNVPRNKNTNN